LGVWVLWTSHFAVEEGHLAVLTRFGALVKAKNAGAQGTDSAEESSPHLFRPGPNWKFPWDKVHTFSTMERVIDLTGEEGGNSAMAADGTVIRLDSKIRFKPKKGNYYSYLFELREPMLHLRELFKGILHGEIACFANQSLSEMDFVGSYSEIRRNRTRFNDQMDVACRDRAGSTYGIEFLGVDLIDIVPPQELETALNGIQKAKSEADTLYAKAEADARQKIEAAREGLEISRLKAQAKVRGYETLAKAIQNLDANGSFAAYHRHRKTELLGDAKLVFVQEGSSLS
jgi:regulator of protease activity HflC (stomatin/prohibitin superfamily)